MHVSLAFAASSLLSFSFLPLASAAAARLREKRTQYCTADDYYEVFKSFVPVAVDVTSLCSGLLGISNYQSTVATVTPRTTEYSTTSIIATTTETVDVYSSTSTVVVTSTQYALRKRETEIIARAVVTPKSELLRPIIERRQNAETLDVSSFVSGIYSACNCLSLTPGTDYLTVTASTMTRDEPVQAIDTSTIDITSTISGVTTVTQTLNFTSHVIPSSWTGTWSSDWTWSTSSPSTSSTPTVPVTMNSDVMSMASMTNSSLISITSSLSSSTSSVPSITPSACPAANGTIISSTDICHSYQIVCGVSFPPEDVYDLQGKYASVSMCADDVCTPANIGTVTPCLGVVWDSATANCLIIKSLDNPISNPMATAELSIFNNLPQCQNMSSSSSTMSASTTSSMLTSSASSMSSIMTAPYNTSLTSSAMSTNSPTSTNAWNGTRVWPHPSNGTRTWPHPTGSYTRSHSTPYSYNQTSSMNSTSSPIAQTSPSSSSVLSGSPTLTSNNTCPICPSAQATTYYATLTSTIFLNAGSGSSIPVSALTTTQPIYVTIYTTSTVVSTYLTTTDLLSTLTASSVETDVVVSTTTTSTIETDIAISTQVETITTSASTTIDGNGNGRYAPSWDGKAAWGSGN